MSRHSGFTLLEFVVALAILGLTLTLLSGGIRFGVRVWEQQAPKFTRQDHPIDRWIALRSLLARSEPQRLPGLARTRALWFDGSPVQLTFIAQSPAAADDARRQWQLYPDQNGHLRLDHRPWPPTTEADMVWESTILTTTAVRNGFELAYWGRPIAAGENDMPDWQPHWRHRPTLPALIRLRLPGTTTEPSFEGIVALRLSGEWF